MYSLFWLAQDSNSKKGASAWRVWVTCPPLVYRKSGPYQTKATGKEKIVPKDTGALLRMRNGDRVDQSSTSHSHEASQSLHTMVPHGKVSSDERWVKIFCRERVYVWLSVHLSNLPYIRKKTLQHVSWGMTKLNKNLSWLDFVRTLELTCLPSSPFFTDMRTKDSKLPHITPLVRGRAGWRQRALQPIQCFHTKTQRIVHHPEALPTFQLPSQSLCYPKHLSGIWKIRSIIYSRLCRAYLSWGSRWHL